MNKNTFSTKTVFLIDGSSFLYRAYYSMRPLHTSQGMPVQAVYGFCRMIKKLIDTYQPHNMLLIWDSKGTTIRHEEYPAYKATRQSPPSDLFEQKKLIKEFAEQIGLHQLEKPGYEADDLIYSVTKDLVDKGLECAIVSSDKDLYQLLGSHVFVIDPFKETIVNKELHEQALGYSIDKIPFYFSLLGDASDNIPGVKGIGKKGAEDLVKQFNSLDDLYARLNEVPKEKTRIALTTYKDDAYLSLKLFLLHYTPLHLHEEYVFHTENWHKAFPFFEQFQFKSLMSDIQKEKPQEEKPVEYFFDKKKITFKTITTQEELSDLVQTLRHAEYIALDTESDGLSPFDDNLVGISICVELGTAYYTPCGHITLEPQLAKEIVIQALKPFFEDEQKKKILQNAKYDALVLAKNGIHLRGIYFDTMIAANLVTPDWQRIGLDKLSLFYLGDTMLDFSDVVKKHKRKNFAYVPLDEATRYSGSDAHQTLALFPILQQELSKFDVVDLFYTIEMPLMRVLTEMELTGIALDTSILKDLSQKIHDEIISIEAKIEALIGKELMINFNSPKQIEDLLFNKLMLPPLKKSDKKTGYSTDQSVLEELSKLNPVPGLILRLRELTKLQNTYAQGLPEYVSRDKKIHTNFSQTATATGRLASSQPNMQNIPADGSEYSQQLRSAFIPPQGHLFIAADYSQIELRVLAYLSQDEQLLQAFHQQQDIHTLTAARLFDTPQHEVVAEQRQVGKRINFSILYGLTPYGLSQDLGITLSEAKTYIEKYFAQYPHVLTWMNTVVDTAKERGYVTTHWKRRRYIPGIYEKNKSLYELARRAAINTVAQGTAAEIMKIGMINLASYLNKHHPTAAIVLQIHDELLISAPEQEALLIEQKTREILESVVSWNVPLEVSTKIGHTWQDVSK